jgi:ABC-type transport system substrate-binding protein
MKPFLVVLGIALMMSAACGDDDVGGAEDSDQEPEGTGQAEQPQDGRRQGGELTLGAPTPASLDPHSPLFGFADVPVNRMLYRGLYSLDLQNRAVSEANGIAAGPAEVSEDGTTVTVTLKEQRKDNHE